MRLFVALEIPAVVGDNLAALLKELRDLSTPLGGKRPRWVHPKNLHVTLKFIGEVENAKVDGISAALATVHAKAPIDLQFRGLGLFPNEIRPTVLWTALGTSTNLQSLALDIDGALATQGIPKEKRAFVPHLTLARFAPPRLHEDLRIAIQKHKEGNFGSFHAREFHLIESKLKPSAAEYTSLQSFSFGAES